MALNKRILIVSFGSSDTKHNERLKKLLSDQYAIGEFSFLTFEAKYGKEYKLRVFLSSLIHLLSVPLIAILIAFQKLSLSVFTRKSSATLLAQSIQGYFDDNHGFTSLVLHLNRTLRQQKVQVHKARQVINAALVHKADCVLLSEDSNFYSSGIMIGGLQEIAVMVGVIDYTIGKKAEFELSRDSLVPERNSRIYAYFAKIMLDSETRNRWLETKEFINCFPGSLETDSLKSLGPGFGSGKADFYLTSDASELDYLRDLASNKEMVCLVEPIELTLAKLDPNFGAQRRIFGIFLPPNQLTDPNVRMRMDSSRSQSYEGLVLKLLDEVRSVREDDEVLMVFPHPRTFRSDPELIESISSHFNVADDYAAYLGEMRCALIFSSAVFSALLEAGIKVFNFDVYRYAYSGVFPVEAPNFIEITEIEDIRKYTHSSEKAVIKTHSEKTSILVFLHRYL